MSLLRKLVRHPPVGAHRGTVFLFHGSCASAEDIRDCFDFYLQKTFAFSHLKVVIPNAPLQPYTPCEGELNNVWFDRIDVDARVPEKLESIDAVGKEIDKLFREENALGIPDNKIIVGGFSMGGALALHAGLRWRPSVAGIFAMSSFLNDGSAVYDHLEKSKGSELPELLQFHGTADDLIPLESGKNTYDKLKALGVPGSFHTIEGLDHSLCGEEVSKLYSWIHEKIPIYP